MRTFEAYAVYQVAQVVNLSGEVVEDMRPVHNDWTLETANDLIELFATEYGIQLSKQQISNATRREDRFYQKDANGEVVATFQIFEDYAEDGDQ
jgi:hypothetical protein